MHLHFEKSSNAKCDCSILSLSWMGKVPDELPEDEGWKLNRTNYYQEGWLATGNARGLVGVTFTTSHCRTRASDLPLRTNYNLRGHQSEVILVKWNEPYQKLASCDSSGVIFVWIKYEGRWSIELINDRSTPVTHFSWSHDGRMALICYRDGFVLVGSVAGQRYWSSMLNDQATITCGIWTPDDQQVYFGTTAGQLIVMDVHGAMVSEVQLSAGITSMAWSAEKFKMEESDDDVSGNQASLDERSHILAVCLADGNIVMLQSFDDLSPIAIRTGLKAPLHAEWSNSRRVLAIAGIKESEKTCQLDSPDFINLLKFYSDSGTLLYTSAIPHTQCPVTALTWGHNDRRLFVATGTRVHTAWVSRRVGSLQLLSRLAVRATLTRESSVQQLPLPPRLRTLVSALFSSTIRSCVPEPRELRRFVSRPPTGNGRLHCTMLRHAGEPAPCYTLYLEYLGGLVPLLKGRRTSKIKPEFVIFDPQSQEILQMPDYFQSPPCSDGSDTEKDTTKLCGSPRNKRKNPRRKEETKSEDQADLSYIDTLPEHARLVEVTSNIWGTKFKFHGLTDLVPANLGQVTYRTSLLHLQPRQMTLVMTELRDDLPAGPDPTFNPNLFSEDEEETFLEPHQGASRISEALALPIAPMTPKTTRFNPPRQKPQVPNQYPSTEGPSLPKTDNCSDDCPYPDHQRALEYCESIKAASSTTFKSSRYTPPRCCDVPALQSPKNTVAPTQILIATSNSTNEYSTNIQRVKNVMADQQARKGFENNKINHEEKNLSCPSNIIPISVQNGQNDTVSPPHYVNYSSVMLQPCTGTFVHAKTIVKGPGCFLGNLNSPSGNYFKGINADSSLPMSSYPSSHSLSQFCSQCTDKQMDVKLTSGKINLNHHIGGKLMGKTEEFKFIEEECGESDSLGQIPSVHRTPTVVSIGPMYPALEPIVRSCSVGYLDLVDAQMVPCDVALTLLRKDAPNKRLVLVSRKTKKRKKQKNLLDSGQQCSKPRLRTCGKSKSLDSSDLFPSTEHISLPPQLFEHEEETVITNDTVDNNEESIKALDIKLKDCGEIKDEVFKDSGNDDSTIGQEKLNDSLSSSLDGLAAWLRDFDDSQGLCSPSMRPTARLPRSSPSSPAPSKKGKRPASASPIRRRLLSSPLLIRRIRKSRGGSSDDEGQGQDEVTRSYRNLETFQKAQLRQKLKHKSANAFGHNTEELVMHNKAPMWNESSQVYQLDFGGRVTQESAKNFQIEYRGKQVMQFGRIDGNAYTLDFQHPFSALQAFAVALANVTQRLK